MPNAGVVLLRGVDEGGIPGLVRGVARGVSGVVVRPLAAALEASARVAASVRSAVSGGPAFRARLRPPRCGDPVITWSSSVCRGCTACDTLRSTRRPQGERTYQVS